MAKLNVKGNAMMDDLAKDLDIPFKRNGSMVVCIHKVTVLGDNSEAEYKRDEEGLHIRTQYRSDLPVVFKIEVL